MSDVYWVDADRMTLDNSVGHRVRRVLQEARALTSLSESMRVALKVNTAEDGYEYGLRPTFLRPVADLALASTSQRPTLCDGLKLVDYWKGRGGHTFLDVARGKGYCTDTLGGNFVINGGFSGDEGNVYPCGRPSSVLGGVEVGAAVCRSDALWVLSHVTLHPLFGWSGALLNGGFECLVGRERSRVLDGIDPYPFNGHRAPEKDVRAFQRRALEGHLSVRAAMEGRVFYVNYLWDVTPQPEYFPYSDGPVVANLGFLASQDPVALDAATLGLLDEALSPAGRAGGGIRGLTGVDPAPILAEAESLGLGSAQGNLEHLS